MYQVVVTEPARKNLLELRRHGKQTLQQIKQALEELTKDPYGITSELHAPLRGYRSLHVGRFRAIIKIVDKRVLVYVVAVGWHESGSREDIYAQLARALRAGTIRLED